MDERQQGLWTGKLKVKMDPCITQTHERYQRSRCSLSWMLSSQQNTSFLSKPLKLQSTNIQFHSFFRPERTIRPFEHFKRSAFINSRHLNSAKTCKGSRTMIKCKQGSPGHIYQISSIIRQHSDTPRQTHAAAAHVQQWVDATYFIVSCLVCWLHILTELISGSLVTVACLSVLGFVPLIGPWPRRSQRVGLQLLNITRDLHPPQYSPGKKRRSEYGKRGYWITSGSRANRKLKTENVLILNLLKKIVYFVTI